jgi:hypothetical protein
LKSQILCWRHLLLRRYPATRQHLEVPNNNAGRGRRVWRATRVHAIFGRKTPGKANWGGKYSLPQHNLKYSRLYNSRVLNKFTCLNMNFQSVGTGTWMHLMWHLMISLGITCIVFYFFFHISIDEFGEPFLITTSFFFKIGVLLKMYLF